MLALKHKIGRLDTDIRIRVNVRYIEIDFKLSGWY